MQLVILCLFTVSVVTTLKNGGGCVSGPCRKHLGVYHVTFTQWRNLTSYAVITYHADGTLSGINSAADGNPLATPAKSPFSSYKGVWKCDGANKMKGSTLFFVYRTPDSPGALAGGDGEAKFDGKGCFSGAINTALYDLASTKDKDRSKWVKIVGPTEYKMEGYKLYDVCDECN